jgi:hypothetical protein
MNAQDKANYIRSAVDASPQKIAVIFLKDHYANGGGHIAVAWMDANNNLVFAQMAPGAEFSGDLPKDTFGNPVLSGATLKALSSDYQTVEAIPIDLSGKIPGLLSGHSPENQVKLIQDTATNFIDNIKDALQKHYVLSPDKMSYAVLYAISQVDTSTKFGKEETIDAKEAQQVLRQWLENFSDFFPNALAKFLLDEYGGEAYRSWVKDNPHVEAYSELTQLRLFGMPDVTLKSKAGIVELGDLLQRFLEKYEQTNPEEAMALATEILTKNGFKVFKPGEEGYDKVGFFSETEVKAENVVSTLRTGLQARVNINFDMRTSDEDIYNNQDIYKWSKGASTLVYSPEHGTWVTLPAPDLPPMVDDTPDTDAHQAPDGGGVKADDYAGPLADTSENARTDDAAQQPATDDDEEASQEQVALTSDTDDARSDGAAQQPATDADEGVLQEQAALAPDTEDARKDGAQQPSTDDDEEASQEEVVLASDTDDARTDDAGVMEAAKEQVVDSPALDDQAGPRLAAAALPDRDDGFSFAAFVRQGVQVEVVKEAMPAGQLSPQDSGSGTPASESAPPAMPALSPEDGRIQTIRAAVEASPPTANQSRFALVFASDRVDGKWNHVFLASLDNGGRLQLAEMRPDDKKRPPDRLIMEAGIGMVAQYKKIEAVPLDVSHPAAREIFLSVAGATLRAGRLDDLYLYFHNQQHKFAIENSGLGGLATDEDGVSLALMAGVIATLSDEARASLQPATHGEEGAWLLEQLAAASQTDDARTDDASQQPATDNDQESSHAEQVAIVSDAEDARTDDDAQPATDDDPDSSDAEQVAIALDTDDARSDDAAQQPATDDDEEASHEEVAIKSDAEDAPTDDGAVMETAKGEVEVTPTVADQAEPQLAASTPVIPGDGFSFSAFAKQGVPVEVAKEALPADHLSPEVIPGSGMPAGESALPDVASEDVGNAAPSKEPVVHHGDLAP